MIFTPIPKTEFDELDNLLLLGIHRGRSYRAMAGTIHRSLGSVQRRLDWLEDNDYIVREPFRHASSRRLTQKGKDKVKSAGLKLE